MQLKKNIFLGAALVLMNSPIAIYADDAPPATLETTNNTHEYSTVKITSHSPNWCTGTLPAPFPKKITPPIEEGGYSSASQFEVNVLCGAGSTVCKAMIHMTKDCSDVAIAEASFDLTTFTITNIRNISTKYSVSWKGTHVYINYA